MSAFLGPLFWECPLKLGFGEVCLVRPHRILLTRRMVRAFLPSHINFRRSPGTFLTGSYWESDVCTVCPQIFVTANSLSSDILVVLLGDGPCLLTAHCSVPGPTSPIILGCYGDFGLLDL